MKPASRTLAVHGFPLYGVGGDTGSDDAGGRAGPVAVPAAAVTSHPTVTFSQLWSDAPLVRTSSAELTVCCWRVQMSSIQ